MSSEPGSLTTDYPEATAPGAITQERMEIVVTEWRDASRRIAEAKAALAAAYADERRLGQELAQLEDAFPLKLDEDDANG